jgi:hypothetical protein
MTNTNVAEAVLQENIYDQKAFEVHQNNVKVGWWTDINSGTSTLLTRNRAELLMLVVSEVSEAAHGLDNDLMDDKLPHLSMFEVEISDVSIRLFDMIGAEASIAGSNRDFDYVTIAEQELEHIFCEPDRQLLRIVNHCSAAMEHLRKGRRQEYWAKLVDALMCTFAIASDHDFNLWDVIDQKLEFNRTRADHQIANRLKANGKKF